MEVEKINAQIDRYRRMRNLNYLNKEKEWDSNIKKLKKKLKRKLDSAKHSNTKREESEQ